MQGTLDFTCGIYAVINALSCTYGLDLASARKIFQETMHALSGQERLWNSFLHNETDHYWLVRWLLSRWCFEPPWQLEIRQPFSDCLCPESRSNDFAGMELYLPETYDPSGPACPAEAKSEAFAVWDALADWLAEQRENSRAALLRFHRFFPGTRQPVVSHWTTAHTVNDRAILLHDASAEPKALFILERRSLLPAVQRAALLRIVPESLVLLSRSAKKAPDFIDCATAESGFPFW
jgi:hypothetical protein